MASSGWRWITSADNEALPGDVAIADLKRAGLPAPSVVRPAKIACIEPGRIDRRVPVTVRAIVEVGIVGHSQAWRKLFGRALHAGIT